MRDANATSRIVWLTLLHQGGWWSKAELLEDVRTRGIELDVRYVSHSLSTLGYGSYIKSRPKNGSPRLREYAVLPDCGIPPGLMLKELTP